MKVPSPRSALFAALAALAFFVTSSSAQVTRQINRSGTTQPQSTQFATPGVENTEVDEGLDGNDNEDTVSIDANGNISGATTKERSIAPGPGQGLTVAGQGKAKSNPEIITSFDG